jgi:hypothetical protein
MEQTAMSFEPVNATFLLRLRREDAERLRALADRRSERVGTMLRALVLAVLDHEPSSRTPQSRRPSHERANG